MASSSTRQLNPEQAATDFVMAAMKTKDLRVKWMPSAQFGCLSRNAMVRSTKKSLKWVETSKPLKNFIANSDCFYAASVSRDHAVSGTTMALAMAHLQWNQHNSSVLTAGADIDDFEII